MSHTNVIHENEKCSIRIAKPTTSLGQIQGGKGTTFALLYETVTKTVITSHIGLVPYLHLTQLDQTDHFVQGVIGIGCSACSAFVIIFHNDN